MRALDPTSVPLAGLNLIEASAGTGKTYTITSLVLRLVVEEGLPIDRILVVTFTEAATAELRDRVRRRLRDALGEIDGAGKDPLITALVEARGEAITRQRLENALRAFDEAAIFTIHGFCQRMLVENAFESGMPFDIELIADVRPLERQVVTDFWTDHTFAERKLLIRYLQDQGVNVPTLVKLVQKLQPGIEIIANAPDTQDLGSQDQYVNAFTEAKWLWANHSAEIHDAVMQNRIGLHQGTYKPEQMDRRFSALDHLLAADAPVTLRLPDAVKKLTQSEIDAKTAKARTPMQHEMFAAFGRLLAAREAVSSVYAKELLDIRAGLVAYAREELPARKARMGVQSFDDLLTMLADALDGPGGVRLAERVRQLYGAALIDEFQDTDPVQYRIFSKIFGASASPTFLIGDPKQAIYAFRGADIFAYLRAADDAADNAHTLETNYRADPTLVRGVNTLFSRVDHPFILERLRFEPVQPRADAEDRLVPTTPPLRLRFLRRRVDAKGKARGWRVDDALAHVAADVAALLAEGLELTEDDGNTRPISPKDIAILVRSNKQATKLQAALRELDVRSVLHSAGIVFDAEEAGELQLVLQAIAEPDHTSAIRAALGTDLLGVSANQLVRLDSDESLAQTWIQRFRDWRTIWSERGFIQMFRSMLEWRPSEAQPQLHARILSLAGGERRMTNLLHLAELLHTAGRTEQLGIAGQLRWLQDRRGDTAAVDPVHELRLESDDTAVKLLTMHSSKGLEFGVVYCPALWLGPYRGKEDEAYLSFHDPDDDFRAKLDISPNKDPAHVAASILEDQAEAMRLAYVALTRAKHLCIALCAWNPGTRESPLGYLLHHPPATTVLSSTPRACADLSDDDAIAELQAIADDSDGAIAVSEIDVDAEPPDLDTELPAGALSAQVATAAVDRSFRTSSFSQLTARSSQLVPHDAEGRDHDETATADALQPVPESPAPGEPEVPLVDLARGPIAGRCVHAIYEELDFTKGDRDAALELVNQKLQAFGLAASNDPAAICDALLGTLAVPLDPAQPNLRMDRVAMPSRLDEMGFLFSVEDELTKHRLADAVAAHPCAGVPAAYAKQIRRLAFHSLHGFMKGYIDLTFQHDGRWYVVDYKTNFLGPSRADYRPDRLEAVMHHHHYTLQALIYSVAVHRFLQQRVPDYDYERDFGGVFYLFVRGMAPSFGADYGVHRFRPTAALIDRLWSTLHGGDA